MGPIMPALFTSTSTVQRSQARCITREAGAIGSQIGFEHVDLLPRGGGRLQLLSQAGKGIGRAGH